MRATLSGTPASRGIAFGRLTFIGHPDLPSRRREVEDPALERRRFEKARLHAIEQLGTLYEASLERLGEGNAVLFQIHQMMLDDPDYVGGITALIESERVNAEYAVDTVGRRLAGQFSAMGNEYMQGRADDVLDISRRVIEILCLHSGTHPGGLIRSTGSEPLIIAAEDLAPSETATLDGQRVVGIATSGGSTRSHTVIFARTLGIPAVIGIGAGLTPELEGCLVALDGDSGEIHIDPDEETLRDLRERKRTADALRQRLELYRGRPTTTLDGRRISLLANVGCRQDVDLALACDAEGIGLFRSEFLFLQGNDCPTEEEQYLVYRDTLEAMGQRPVIIRTIDIGADKTAPYLMLRHEDNPAMGFRAVRLCLAHRDIFRAQLRALYRASAHGNLSIMFPLIISADEIAACRHLCDEVKEELRSEGQDFNPEVPLGIMVETPAAALIADELAPLSDFFSIGTNDLTQFTLAVDRQNADVGKFLNPYHHAVIRLIEATVRQAHAAKIPVGVCGELGADEGFTHELVRLGVDEISVVPAGVLALRARIASMRGEA
ncbi:MAG: phosphoenolpyruvate--protein phosphotransferase [Succinivibrionaceae bacterium]|nr:phosphoenolpyruvate--protein phosphotransferase [Succinivibrionaceae bacterium]